MRATARHFRIRLDAAGWETPRELLNGALAHLSLREDGLWNGGWQKEPTGLERDLVRVGFAIYAADRLVRRQPPKSFQTPVREIELTIEVSDPSFWNEHIALIREALGVLCDDVWELHFQQGPPVAQQLRLLQPAAPPESVWQYSGGLDSLAGGIIRAANTTGRVVPVTAMHQSHQGDRVTKQLKWIAEQLDCEMEPAMARTTFGPRMREIYPRFDYQEPTQRCRAFLFTACGGATASVLGCNRVEIFENGVGVINLPLMAGMAYGSRSTRGCHPKFLRTMSRLVSNVAARPIRFELPFASWTKAEMVRRAAELTDPKLLAESMSCVHPLRIRGRAKHCGLCPACLGRRQAFHLADLKVDVGQYVIDVLDPANPVDRESLNYLAATLMQVIELENLTDTGSRPESLRRHLASTDLLRSDESARSVVAILRRYRDEWLNLIHQQHARGQRWNGLLPNQLAA